MVDLSMLPSVGQKEWGVPLRQAILALDEGKQDAAALAADVGALAAPGSGSQLEATLNATYETGTAKVVHVSPDGNDAWSGLTSSKPKKTLAAALEAMGAGVKGTIVMGHGDIDAGTGVSWTGYRCGLVGQGPLATRIVASGNTGPILDFTGVGYNLDGVDIGNFTIHGDNTPGAAKSGIAFSSTVSMTIADVHDIHVRYTGGPCFDLGVVELTTFSRLVAYQPVSAVTDDVPYVKATGQFNGNAVRDLVMVGTAGVSTQSVGASGALVVKANDTYAPHANSFEFIRLQTLVVGDGGCAVSIAGNDNEISHFQPFDCAKVSGATGTAYIRLLPPTVSNSGGTRVTGVIPGKGTAATDIDTGVDIRQSRNAVVGVKGYRGANVTLATGVDRCYVELHGSVAASSDPGVIDNSGASANTITDRYLGTTKRPAQTITQGSTSVAMDVPGSTWGQGGVRFYDPATPANGTVGLGTSQTRMQAIGATFYGTADAFQFRTLGLVNLFGLMSSGVKGIRLYDAGTLPAASATYRGVIALSLGATGVADRLVICRKDAADAYAWVDLF